MGHVPRSTRGFLSQRLDHCLFMSEAFAGTESAGLFATRCLNPAYPAATIIAASVGRIEGEFSGH